MPASHTGSERLLSVIGGERPPAADAGRRTAAVIPVPSPIGRFLQLSPPLWKTWGELGVFLKRELPLAEHKLKSALIGGLSFRPFKSRGSWEFGQPFSFCPRRGEDKQRAIYNAIEGSRTASFWGDSVTSDINTSNYLHLCVLTSKKSAWPTSTSLTIRCQLCIFSSR